MNWCNGIIMKIAIIGGTGSIGRGFSLHWSQKHEIIIGSRDLNKAKNKASEYLQILEKHGLKGNIKGDLNLPAAEAADIVVLAIRYAQLTPILEEIKNVLSSKVVISVVVPMERDFCIILPGAEAVEIPTNSEYKSEFFCYIYPPKGSAAQEIASILPKGTLLTSAFHNVPAAKLSNLDLNLDYDVGVCGNNMHAKNIVFNLIRDIGKMRPLDIGPLEASSQMESLTPLLINIAIRNQMKNVGLRFVE